MPANSFPVSAPSLSRIIAPPAPRRYLALWLPFLSTDRARRNLGARPDSRPFVLAGNERGALRIAALDAVALRHGLAIGMALAEARALVPDMITAGMDAQGDATLLDACADACGMFTPLVALNGLDGLVLDITGCAHLFGGETALLRRVRRRLADLGLKTCGAIAGTPEAARAFARYRANSIVASGDEKSLARDLPLAALEQTPETTLALGRAGFSTLGDLMDRPSHLISARFGAALLDQLNRIVGDEDIRITPLRPPPEIMAEKHFPEPLAHAAQLLGVLNGLARDVSASLERRAAGARAYEASFFRADGAVRRIGIETGIATRDPAVLIRLLTLKIEALTDPLDPGFGFDAIRLDVLRSERLDTCQIALEAENRRMIEGEEIAALADRLIARLGPDKVRCFVAQDSHDPVRAGGTSPYRAGPQEAAWMALTPGEPPVRPLTLFDHPQLIEVLAEVPDSPPLRFRWRRVLHEVRLAEGPERIAPEWWRSGDPAPATRDYYRVEDARGHRFWIFREGLYDDTNTRPRWFLHGLFA